MINDNKQRDLYNDNITDVSSLQNLADVETLNLLSKNGTTLHFEFADDFWKLEKGMLYQYPDYVSMIRNEKEKVVYNGDDLQDEKTNTLYGKIIKEAIDNEPSFEAMPDFTLKERDNYIKRANKSVDGAIRMPFTMDKEKIQQKVHKVEEITNKAFESIDKQETKPVLDLVKLCIKTLAMFMMFYKKNTLEYQKEKIVDKIVKGLDDNTFDIDKILADKEINQKIPELKEILSRYKEQYVPLDIKSQKETIGKILGDETIREVADKLSENADFKEQLADKFSIEVTKKLDTLLPQGYDKKMTELYTQSETTNPLDFSKEILLKNLEEIYLENKKISPEEYALSVAYIAQMVNPDENKNLIVESMTQASIENTTSTDKKILSAVESVVQKCIKNELDLTKTQQKHL